MGHGAMGRALRRGVMAVLVLTAGALAGGVPDARADLVPEPRSDLTRALADLTGKVVVTGRVTGHDTGRALPGICVHLTQNDQFPVDYYATTDALGRYLFRADDHLSLSLHFTDCRSQPRYAQVREFLDFDPDGYYAVDAVMAVGAVVEGAVTTAPDGTPLPAACANLHQHLHDHQGKSVVFHYGTAEADDSGQYTFELLNPVPAEIQTYPCALHEDAYRTCTSNNSSTPQICVPLFEQSPYAPVTEVVPIGEGATVPVTTELPIGGVLEGRVTTSSGEPVPNVGVRLWDSTHTLLRASGNGWAFTDANGYYRMVGLQQFTDATLYFFPPKHPVHGQFAVVEPITIGPGQTITGIDAIAPPGCAGC